MGTRLATLSSCIVYYGSYFSSADLDNCLFIAMHVMIHPIAMVTMTAPNTPVIVPRAIVGLLISCAMASMSTALVQIHLSSVLGLNVDELLSSAGIAKPYHIKQNMLKLNFAMCVSSDCSHAEISFKIATNSIEHSLGLNVKQYNNV